MSLQAFPRQELSFTSKKNTSRFRITSFLKLFLYSVVGGDSILKGFPPCIACPSALASCCEGLSSHLMRMCVVSLTEEEEEDSDSGSEVDVKKAGRRHKLLRKKLTLSEGESDNDKPSKSNKEAKRRGRRKG